MPGLPRPISGLTKADTIKTNDLLVMQRGEDPMALSGDALRKFVQDNGTDAAVTAESIKNALGYTPANQQDVDQVMEELQNKVPFRYITVTVKSTEGDTGIPTTITTSIGGAVYSTVAYEGTPVALAIPDGVSYQITASPVAHYGDVFYHDPTALDGVAMEDAQAEIIYAKLDGIHSFADVKMISDMGLAPQYFQIGDVLTTTYTDVNGTQYECPWIVVSTAGATLADGTRKDSGVYLQMQYATIEAIQYDDPEVERATETTAQEGLYYYGFDGTNYTLLSLSAGDTVPYSEYTEIYHNEIEDTTCNILRNGYNREAHSAYRQWLNSDAAKGNWWKAQHVGDCAPYDLNSVRGFLAGLPEDFVSCMAEIQVTQALNTVSEPDKTIGQESYTAKVFLPHLEQMYVIPQAAGIEGEAWDYYKQLAQSAGLTGEFGQWQAYPILKCYTLDNHASAQSVRLASANRGDSYVVCGVHSSGMVDGNNANGVRRCRPACFI